MKSEAANDFPAVEMLEQRPYDRIREFYLYEEPALMAAMRRCDRGEATRIINHILVHIYSAGQERSDLLKGLLLEIVVMVSRAAVEAGAMQSEVLDMNFQCIRELAGIEDDEHLARWLRAAMERMFAAMERREDFAPPMLVAKALRYMREHLHSDVSRDETAYHAGASPSHFSRLLRERTGQSFTDMLRHCRVNRACEMLEETESSLAEIAGECGFCDQSYFTHVFQKIKGITPRQFREARRRKQAAGRFLADRPVVHGDSKPSNPSRNFPQQKSIGSQEKRLRSQEMSAEPCKIMPHE